MFFKLHQTDEKSAARAGVIQTAHGLIPTPIFMPVGTQATVKGLHQRELVEDLDAPIILSNTYHLYLRPGHEVLRAAGGIHKFMGWERAVLTDSGGYQVYSLSDRRKMSEEGVLFQAITDGSRHMFTPEHAMAVQRAIGADIIMAFDECTPFPCSYTYAKESMARTHRWLKRCQAYLNSHPPLYGYPQAFFPIVQGGIYKDLRIASAEQVAAADGAGCAIGGVCHPTGQLYEVTRWVCEHLPKEKPRYLMGVGTPKDLLESIACGVDMFDCVLPARNGRNGMLFTSKGIMRIKNARYKTDFQPIDSDLGGYVSSHYSRAYLHHLIRSGERLGAQIATLHNLAFYLNLVRTARKKILNKTYAAWKDRMVQETMRPYAGD